MFKLKILQQLLKIKFRKPFKSRAELELHQQKGLAQFVKNTLKKSAFYGRYISNGALNLNDVPLMDKQKFMEHFDTINTAGINLNEAMETALKAENSRDFSSEINGITVGLSTGTSGKRGIFLASESERAQWTAAVLTRVIHPKLFRKQKVAFFLRANSNLYSSVSSSLFQFRYFDIFQPMACLLADLNAYQPDIVAAQPSILMAIAEAAERRQISIAPLQIISFAEVLHGGDKAYIELQLKDRITEVYQYTEGFLGVSCQHGTIHINEDYLIMEKDPIDDVRFYPIITDFTRTTQPVIRYRLDDVLVARTTPCPCGSALMGIERIEGRDDDVLIFGTRKLYPDLLVRRIALKMDNYSRYQIRQIAPDVLSVAMDVPDDRREVQQILMRSAITQLLEEQDIPGIEIRFTSPVAHEQGTKFRKIKRMI